MSGFKRLLGALGPGVTTGAADDDPSGVATYSVVGAQFGTAFLWSAFVTWPLMGCVQMMSRASAWSPGWGWRAPCAQKFPRWIVGHDRRASCWSRTPSTSPPICRAWPMPRKCSGRARRRCTSGCSASGFARATVWLRYHQIASVLKWLALSLCSPMSSRHSWCTRSGPSRDARRAAAQPARRRDRLGCAGSRSRDHHQPLPVLLAGGPGGRGGEGRGTAPGRHRRGATSRELADRRIDVGVGTFFSNSAMFFIILTTALTLHRHGITTIKTPARSGGRRCGRWPAITPISSTPWASSAPGCSRFRRWPAPRLTPFAETFDWAYGLDEKLRERGVVLFGIHTGDGRAARRSISSMSIRSRRLYWSAIINGVLAPFVLVALLLVASDPRIMHGQVSSSPITRAWCRDDGSDVRGGHRHAGAVAAARCAQCPRSRAASCNNWRT